MLFDFMLKLVDYKKKMRHAFLILAEKVYTYLRAINVVFSNTLKKELLKIPFLKWCSKKFLIGLVYRWNDEKIYIPVNKLCVLGNSCLWFGIVIDFKVYYLLST